jgi:hypothetical protein
MYLKVTQLADRILANEGEDFEWYIMYRFELCSKIGTR